MYELIGRVFYRSKMNPTRAPQQSQRSSTSTKEEGQPNKLSPPSKGGLPLHGSTINSTNFRTRSIKPQATAYSHPTSSFAGGTSRTSIFGSGSEGDSLLRVYHDTVVKPLIDRAGDGRKSRRVFSLRGEPAFQYTAFY